MEHGPLATGTSYGSWGTCRTFAGIKCSSCCDNSCEARQVCGTIHKSQGVTYDFPYSIHEWDHPNFDFRLKYVALSRTTQLQNMHLASQFYFRLV